MNNFIKDKKKVKDIVEKSYINILDPFNKHGPNGGIFQKAKYAAEWEAVRRHLEIHTYRRTLLTKPDRIVRAIDTLNERKPREYLFFASNGYLNLASHPKVIEKSHLAMKEWGVSSCASSVIGGKTQLHVETEEKLADYLEMESAFLFPSGSTANESVLTALARPGDSIIGDNKNHLSINLPCSALNATSKGRISYKKYQSNDIQGLTQALETAEGSTIVITDGVFSMDGTVSKLDEISSLCKKNSSTLIVDDSHGVGVIGKNGKGTHKYFNVHPDIITGSCAKALGGNGGFAAGSREVIDYIEAASTAAIYSTYQTAGIAAALSASLDIIQEQPELVTSLLQKSNYLKDSFKKLGIKTTNSITAIVPVIFDSLDQSYFMAKYLNDAGIYVNIIYPPAVKEPRARFSVCVNHKRSDLDYAIETVRNGLLNYKHNFSDTGKTFLEQQLSLI
ncbi:hypothetical protein THZG08_30184 [Vibrio owensii]|uniref:aminotransferase class I/II-fold pyridoxal phosphate-dependent enzyme n=1 Tax=Vibrio owensii TaxID=696485 RepID=UPI002894B81A|nr:hypothetical protein THZG08_30184 [Vibrio owensii]CAH1569042.1 hypothetical protein THOA03_30183 [Vibrio owensii]